MARQYKSVPEGATIIFEGREYPDQFALPPHATEFDLVWWGAKDPSLPATGENRVGIYINGIQRNTRRGLIQDRLNDVLAGFIAQYPGYSSNWASVEFESEQGSDGEPEDF